jgi:hypothetical protein
MMITSSSALALTLTDLSLEGHGTPKIVDLYMRSVSLPRRSLDRNSSLVPSSNMGPFCALFHMKEDSIIRFLLL